jgi:hypothetical protein
VQFVAAAVASIRGEDAAALGRLMAGNARRFYRVA